MVSDYITGKNLNQLLDEFSKENSIIISNYNFKPPKKDFPTTNINEFCEFVLRKSPLFTYPKTISDMAGISIISTIISQTFKSNNVLYNLTKTKNFAKELYKLFDKFLSYGFSAKNLEDALSQANIDLEDSERFKIIIKTYNDYKEKCKNFFLIPKTELPQYTTNILLENKDYLNIIRKQFENVIIDVNDNFTESQKTLLELFPNLIKINFSPHLQNTVAEAIEEKYINKSKSTNFSSPKNLEILSFNDIRDEIGYIITDILQKISQDNSKYSDFAIGISGSSHKKILEELLNLANIPNNLEVVNYEYKDFALKLSQYLSISDCIIKLKHDMSKTDKEILYNEMNLHFENLLSAKLENSFIKDKFLFILQNSTEQSLINCVKNNLSLLSKNDSIQISNELALIKKITELYEENNLIKIISLIIYNSPKNSTEFLQNSAQLIKKINQKLTLCYKLNLPKPNLDEIIEIVNNINPNTKTISENILNVTEIKNISHNYYKKIYIIGMSEKVFPAQNQTTEFISNNANQTLSTILKKLNSEFDYIYQTSQQEIIQAAKELISALNSAENILISTHKYEEKKTVSPSIFFQYLSNIFPKNTEEKNFCLEHNHNAVQLNLEFISQTQTQTNVIKNDDTLKLSATAISDFQTCPRKFYFADLLGLKKTGTFAANYGIIVHTIMENFNKNFLHSYSSKTLINLTNILFNSANNPQAAIEYGFDKKDIDLIAATDLLSLSEMQQNFLSAIEELDKNGFFNKIPNKILSEQRFSFSIKEIPNVIFDGRIDAIYRFGDQYKIVDFKTGRTKGQLSYYISENGVNFKTPKGAPSNVEQKQAEYQYQIPIYFLASQNAENLKNYNINSFELLYIRPKNKKGGFQQDSINIAELETFKSKIIENLNETIITKIRNCKYFEPNYNEYNCANCAFKSLCKTQSEEEND